MSFEEYLLNKSSLIDQHLSALIAEERAPYGSLFTAARYSLLAGGKRLRPILLLTTVEILEGNISQALVPACAVEMVHTYSLIHDDLPCMDNDDFRRGKPSLHKAFSEAHAVLAGDFLLSYAFEVLADHASLRMDQKVKLISLLAKGCGGKGMIAGQIMDIEAEGKAIDQTALQLIHQYKTGALISAAVIMGAVVADTDEKTIAALKNYGDTLGLAFQIMDDVLDVKQSMQKHGQLISSDLTNNKTTYVTLLGIEKAERLVGDLVDAAKSHLKAIRQENSKLSDLADLVMRH